MSLAFPPCVLPIGAGSLALSPMLDRGGDFAAQWQALQAWHPQALLSLIEAEEDPQGFAMLRDAAKGAGLAHWHYPITDFDVPRERHPAVLGQVSDVLREGGRVFLHCMGGCGRSGMIALRLMIGFGEATDLALTRLRQARPCAVETEAQRLWAEAL